MRRSRSPRPLQSTEWSSMGLGTPTGKGPCHWPQPEMHADAGGSQTPSHRLLLVNPESRIWGSLHLPRQSPGHLRRTVRMWIGHWSSALWERSHQHSCLRLGSAVGLAAGQRRRLSGTVHRCRGAPAPLSLPHTSPIHPHAHSPSPNLLAAPTPPVLIWSQSHLLDT